MGEFVVYSIKSGVILAFMFLFFKLLLSTDTFHRFNRYVLLGLPVIAAVIPLIHIERTMPDAATQLNVDVSAMLQPVVIATSEPHMSWAMMVVGLYVAGVMFFVLKMIISYLSLLRNILSKRESKTTLPSGTRLIVSSRSDIAPFSWMRYIVLPNHGMDEGIDAVIAHEEAHIDRHHSIDILYADVICAIQWFNPVAWLYKATLQEVHEYEADEEVLRSGFDARDYQMLLIKKAVGSRLYSMTNSLNHSSIKKRITMMLCKKSNPVCRMKLIYVLPLAALSVATFATIKAETPLQEISEVKVSDLSQNLPIISQEKTAPAENGLLAQAEKTKKKAVVEKALDEGVAVGYGQQTTTVTSSSGAEIRVRTDNGTNRALEGKEKPLIVVNGKVCDSEQLNNIPTETIESMTVLKGNEAISQYGEKAKDGAIIITLKDSSKATGENGKVSETCEQLPQFPGGDKALINFLLRNIKYPASMKNIKNPVRVIAQFVVETDGSIKDYNIFGTERYQTLNAQQKADCKQEVERLLKSMPRWEPGKMRVDDTMSPVAVKHSLPITFAIRNKE